jgi:septum site-determining protein MinD
MTKIIVVASGKGGTGKTSLVAGVSAALASAGKKVLVIDGDSGLRNLDIVLGMSDRVVFSFADVASGMISLEEAAVKHPKLENLYLLTAPADPIKQELTQDEMRSLVRQIRDAKFRYVLIDGPAGLAPEYAAFAAAADEAIVVSTGENGSLRGAERMARLLEGQQVRTVRLAVNRVSSRMVKCGGAATIDDAMDTTGLCLLGVVPEDASVSVCAAEGTPIVTSKQDGAACAYTNIARRLTGENVPLMRLK